MHVCQEQSLWQSRIRGQLLPLPSTNPIKSHMAIKTTRTCCFVNAHLQPFLCVRGGEAAEREGVERERRVESFAADS